jgi:formylglycine-generating enzyme required for sulfatase activity
MSFQKIIIPAALVAALAAIGYSQRAAIQAALQPRPASPPAAAPAAAAPAAAAPAAAAVLTVKAADAPPAPSGFAVENKGTDFVLLNWGAVSGDRISYEVSAGDWKEATDATTLRVADLKPSTTYTFAVRAIQRKLRSAPATLEATTNAPPPGPVVGSPWTLRLPNNAALEMLPVAAGSFTMGSGTGHRVEITKPYWLGKFEVTQAQWQAVMGSAPSRFKGAQHPVESVSWNDAVEFCEKLTNQERAAGRLPTGYRYTLPTEAQWEYACRAGTTGDYGGSGALNEMGWYGNNSGHKTHDVGGKSPNAWGFYDMHGNVWEWCSDWHGSYPSGSVSDPAGPNSGSDRVLRGGSWNLDSNYCRSAVRDFCSPGYRFGYGFRVALAPASVR